MKRLFVDANVLLEVLLNRRLAVQCLTVLSDPLQQYGISALTVHKVWYMAEKYKLDRDKVDEMLSPWEILPIDVHTIKMARTRYDGAGFEDCLQAACAEGGEYDQIVTIDKNFQQHSSTMLSVSIVT